MNVNKITEKEMESLFETNPKLACIFNPNWVIKRKHIDSIIEHNPEYICKFFPDAVMKINNQESLDILANHNFVWLLFNHTEVAINKYSHKVRDFVIKIKDILPSEEFDNIYTTGSNSFNRNRYFHNSNLRHYPHQPMFNQTTPPPHPFWNTIPPSWVNTSPFENEQDQLNNMHRGW